MVTESIIRGAKMIIGGNLFVQLAVHCLRQSQEVVPRTPARGPSIRMRRVLPTTSVTVRRLPAPGR